MPDETSANALNAPANADGVHEEPKESAEVVNQRVLRESREWKAKFQALKHETQELEKSKLASQQEWKTLAEKLTAENTSLKEMTKQQKIRSAVHDRALKAGCLNVEDLLAVGNRGLLQVDEETNEVNGADLFVDEAKRLKPYLFQQAKTPGKSSTINSVTPGGGPEKRISSTDIASLKTGDPRKTSAWMDAMKAKPSQRS